MAIKNKYSDEYEQCRRDYVYKQGIVDNITVQINDINNEIARIDKDKPDGNIDDLKEQLDNMDEMYKKYNNRLSSLITDSSNLDISINKLISKKNELERNNNSIKHEIEDLKSGKPCPTCGRPMIEGPIDKSLMESKLNIIKTNFDDIKLCISKIDQMTNDKSNISSKIENIKSRMSEMSSRQVDIRNLISELAKYKDTTDDKKKVYELNQQIEQIQSSMLDLKKDELEYESLRDVSHHCTSLVAKQFRGYLLDEIIDFMNTRLLQYSTMLFSNSSDIIGLTIDASKLDIYLGDALYDTLSGGERKKVDIALVLAQRDLALNISGISCNILILDEIIENCDQVATDSVLNILVQAAGDIDSMYIISHNNYTISYDSVITVVKDAKRLSKILIS